MKEYISEKKESDPRFLQFAAKWKVPFCMSLAIGTIVVIVGGIITTNTTKLGYILIGTGLILIGLTLMFFPFATPQTFKILGIEKGKTIVRVLGVLVIILGMAFIFLQELFVN